MFKVLPKKVWISIMITVIVILVGGVLAYQYLWLPKEEAKNNEINLPLGYTLSNYTVEKVLDVSCTKDSDCEIPGEYAMLSRCPMATLCFNKKCTVVCPHYQGLQTAKETSWKTYTNKQYGFEIKYPISTQIKDLAVMGGENISFILADNQRVLDLRVITKAGFKCGSDTASGADSPDISLDGVIFMGINLSKEYSGAYGHVSAVEHCAVHGGLGYELIPQITYAPNTESPIVDEDSLLNQMLSTFKFTN